MLRKLVIAVCINLIIISKVSAESCKPWTPELDKIPETESFRFATNIRVYDSACTESTSTYSVPRYSGYEAKPISDFTPFYMGGTRIVSLQTFSYVENLPIYKAGCISTGERRDFLFRNVHLILERLGYTDFVSFYGVISVSFKLVRSGGLDGAGSNGASTPEIFDFKCEHEEEDKDSPPPKCPAVRVRVHALPARQVRVRYRC